MKTLIIIGLVFVILYMLRQTAINSFKIGYYEKKLHNRNVDISSVENIRLIDIIKM